MTADHAPPAEGELLFVYAADSGPFNTLADIGHKIFSPQTYPCRLCALTHGYFTERRQWRAFVESLGRPVHFLHRDEVGGYPELLHAQVPAIWEFSAGQWVCRMGPADIAGCDDLAALEAAVSSLVAGA